MMQNSFAEQFIVIIRVNLRITNVMQTKVSSEHMVETISYTVASILPGGTCQGSLTDTWGAALVFETAWAHFIQNSGQPFHA